MDSIAGTLDAHLKQCLACATAGWVAVMLETAGVVHLDRTPPAKGHTQQVITLVAA
jgi:hypothetical protein